MAFDKVITHSRSWQACIVLCKIAHLLIAESRRHTCHDRILSCARMKVLKLLVYDSRMLSREDRKIVLCNRSGAMTREAPHGQNRATTYRRGVGVRQQLRGDDYRTHSLQGNWRLRRVPQPMSWNSGGTAYRIPNALKRFVALSRRQPDKPYQCGEQDEYERRAGCHCEPAISQREDPFIVH